MEKDKKPEFVVTDRRKFNVDGEPRPDTQAETQETNAAPSAPPVGNKGAVVEPGASTPKTSAQQKPSAAKSTISSEIETGYNGDKERTAFGGQKMEFIHLLDMLVQTAMMYAGAMEGGTERRVDVVGLRQMIDLIALLEEKTKGNLTEQEDAVLKNTLFQLRMTYMEIVNMIDRQALQKGPGTSGVPRK